MPQIMHEFVDCYEKAFANRTEWKLVYRRLFDEEDKEQEEIDSALPPGADNPLSSEAGEGLSVEWSNPSLLEQAYKYEKVPCGMHQGPYFILW